MIKTVLGDIKEDALGITLPHEHICCYSEYAYRMAGKAYLDKELLVKTAVAFLKELKEKYRLSTFVDCTPVNIGRDLDILKQVAEQSEVNIICSTGFYYTDEPVLYHTSAERICDWIVSDAEAVNAGIIKCAVEQEKTGEFQEKLLRATAMAHLDSGLPIVMHTNAQNQNARKALEILLGAGVPQKAITVGHLSDTSDLNFVKEVASYGCFLGLDRLYENTSEKYVDQKVSVLAELCRAGYEDQILLSHDAAFFNGFDAETKMINQPRFAYCFEYILPKLPKELSDKIMIGNPTRMLRYK